MKKKLLSALLVAAMTVSVLAGCGGKTEETDRDNRRTDRDHQSSDSGKNTNEYRTSLQEDIPGDPH